MVGNRSPKAISAFFLGACLIIGSGTGALAAPTHPLDALVAEEYTQVRDLLLNDGVTSETSAFAMIRMLEPAKVDVLAWRSGDPMPRRALAVIRDGAALREAVVDLAAAEIVSVETIEGQQSSILFGEWIAAGEITMNDPGWQAAMAERGYDSIDPERFFCLPLSAGYFAEPEIRGHAYASGPVHRS